MDLRPKTADLLKRLLKQKVAVYYIEKILAAFEEEVERIAVPDASMQTTGSARGPRRTSLPSQLLVDSLTNRELDILELLAQRLSNKELINSHLFAFSAG